MCLVRHTAFKEYCGGSEKGGLAVLVPGWRVGTEVPKVGVDKTNRRMQQLVDLGRGDRNQLPEAIT